MYLNNLYYSTLTTERPIAHITRGKNRLKSYGLNYYLKDGSNFEIELYNPKSIRVLAKIKINGLPISAGGIVVNPGQRVFLERFIESEQKFEFSTYQVGNTEQNRQAVKNNGLVEIDFFDEYMPINSWNHWINPYFSTGSTIVGSTKPVLTNYLIAGASSTTSSLFENTSCKLETGRVEMGEKSEQVLETAHGNFSSVQSEMYQFKLMPESEKSVEAGEIRNYCPGCGTRVKKSSWKFCPGCGESLNG